MRYPAFEKAEIIALVEQSHLPQYEVIHEDFSLAPLADSNDHARRVRIWAGWGNVLSGKK